MIKLSFFSYNQKDSFEFASAAWNCSHVSLMKHWSRCCSFGYISSVTFRSVSDSLNHLCLVLQVEHFLGIKRKGEPGDMGPPKKPKM